LKIYLSNFIGSAINEQFCARAQVEAGLKVKRFCVIKNGFLAN